MNGLLKSVIPSAETIAACQESASKCGSTILVSKSKPRFSLCMEPETFLLTGITSFLNCMNFRKCIHHSPLRMWYNPLILQFWLQYRSIPYLHFASFLLKKLVFLKIDTYISENSYFRWNILKVRNDAVILRYEPLESVAGARRTRTNKFRFSHSRLFQNFLFIEKSSLLWKKKQWKQWPFSLNTKIWTVLASFSELR